MIDRFGVEGARSRAASKFEHTCVDAAAAMLDARSATDVAHAGLAVTCLPHRRLDSDGEEGWDWTRNIGDAVYRLKSGQYADGTAVGIPFGAKARMILLYLHDQAIRGGSRTIEVVPSMHAWVRSMGIRIGGMTYRQVADQAVRIAGCRLSVSVRGLPSIPADGGRFVDDVVQRSGATMIAFASPPPPPLPDIRDFAERIVLNEAFYHAILASPIPVRLPALRQIGDNGWAIDLYIWLAYQLPRLENPMSTAWDVLFSHFGVGHKRPRQTKASFIRALQLVLAVYPEALVEIGDPGFTLFPSPPPVQPPQDSK
jgi:hypothetical protein